MLLKENELFKEIQQGKIKAFDELFNQFYSSLCTYSADIIKHHELAEEIVQDVFLKLWNNRASIIIKSSVQAYLYRMVHNQTINYIRDHDLTYNENISFDDLNNRLTLLGLKSSSDIITEMINHQIENDLELAVNNLPEQCREIFLLARYHNHSYSEIATKLGISVSTVKTQMLRAIDKIKIVLDKY